MPQDNTVARNVPLMNLERLKGCIRDLYGIEGSYRKLEAERDLTYRIRSVAGDGYVVKLSNIAEPEGIVDFQVKALEHIARIDPMLPVPRMVPSNEGRPYTWVEGDGGQRYMLRILTYIEGNILQDVYDFIEDKSNTRRRLGAFVGRLSHALRSYHHPFATENAHLWDLGRVLELGDRVEDIADPNIRQMCSSILAHARASVYPALQHTRHQILHQDGHMGNLLVGDGPAPEFVGVIDFGDMLYGSILADIACAADAYLDDETDPMQVLCEVCAGFDSVVPLEEAEIDLVYDMSLLRLVNTVIVINSRQQSSNADDSGHLGTGDKHARMLRLMVETGREEGCRRLRRICGFPVPATVQDAALHQQRLMAKRSGNLGDIWHFYDDALNFTRGDGAYLFAADGKRYLDAYNNVPQVGHSHPHVVKSLSRQAAALNTNTRYVCDAVADYAERLLATLPDEFDTCMFVNSGSEANDVAAQLAHYATGHAGALVMEAAYHGVTAKTADLSPLSGGTKGDHVECLRAPDTYRDVPMTYAADCDRAIAALAERGLSPALFMVDSAFCSNGVYMPPEGYLATVADKVHAAGGLVIADEVQSGLGRLGRMWGHQAQGLMQPDIVTLGKPVGNGHPLGAVLTRRELFEPFNDEVEIFSTFGGNTVSCAAGAAVLDVIENDDLIERANNVGDYFRDQLRGLADRHSLIGDVRGKGMLIGLEFVTNQVDKTPATAETARIVQMMMQNGVLVGASGPFKSSLKLRPALIWEREEVDLFIKTLDRVLQDL